MLFKEIPSIYKPIQSQNSLHNYTICQQKQKKKKRELNHKPLQNHIITQFHCPFHPLLVCFLLWTMNNKNSSWHGSPEPMLSSLLSLSLASPYASLSAHLIYSPTIFFHLCNIVKVKFTPKM